MKKMIASFVAIGLTIALLGCSQTSDEGHDHDHEGHTHASATPKVSETVNITPTPGQKVEVSSQGTKFDPAVPVGSIPDGSWACVMGDEVHFASSDKGAGECAVCGMNLTQTGGEK
jgi:ABC-type Fe3+-hydroxamate transport system substrate-binding protein